MRTNYCGDVVVETSAGSCLMVTSGTSDVVLGVLPAACHYISALTSIIIQMTPYNFKLLTFSVTAIKNQIFNVRTTFIRKTLL
jgi:hypothetical protein